ncbi:branched-chain amino acid ABC transporter permease [Malaciobacter molluscorum LMG 25693]|uniref:Branched-chain amino acid ABC transporter permease n=1 Tax=Malaciobacter molluscorum LMG 25693 TaxID=870501 RepID=A0A2G1DGN4_9BACT|nr:branched-chain amino acid ABC transporter permease [Malaciobacter molluscorum]AXX92487.1 high-affinity branched-chain amino acid ABC transporter, permease protein [Malaciobacter molluscorum LMG 25693]PHO17643.1 branched-chain amino acid ABC transporter permease [Malaciobacter molluscorum LMG 25693]RXJ93459.1 branched-chain amino acid ABC transporter permease [Malaciobacter molluscorum]
MDIFFQQLINGLTIGSLYALVALGYTMVYGVMKLINFAHGDLVAFSAYVGLTIFSQFFGANANSIFTVITIFLFTALIVAFVGVVLERLAYKPLRTAPRLSAVVSALGASLVIQNSIMLIWGPNMKIFPSNLIPNTTWQIGGVILTFTQVIILALSAVLMVALYFFINKTKIGTAIRATAIDQDAAKLMGINVNRIIMIIFIVGSALGAVGGLFIGIYYRGLTFDMGWLYGLNAFIAAIIGGIGSIPGAMLGGLLLGLFNAMISGYISTEWADTFTFILLIIILIVRPTGILGEKIAEKV